MDKLIARQICKFAYYKFLRSYRPVSSVVEPHAIGAGGLGSITGPVKSAQCRLWLAIIATFLRSCVAHALNRGDGPRHSLLSSAKYRECNEDLV